MRTRSRVIAFLILFGVIASGVSAYTIRVGSVAPENSPWGRALNRMAAEWERISDGRLTVQVFPNAITGNEADMIRKMRIGQLQAVVLTTTALTAFSDQVLTLSMPLLIRSEEEYEHVFQHVREDIEAEIEEEGFHVLQWSMAGWLKIFTKDPIRHPDEMREVKLAASPEEMDLVRAYQLMGYQPIPISYQERLAALTNGMANGYLTVPILAAGFQWFALTPNMIDMNVGPSPGAVLMSDRAWRRLPPDIIDERLEVSDEIAAELSHDIKTLEQEAVDTMVNYGLSITTLSPEEEELWAQELAATYDVTLGLVFDEAMYHRVQGLLDEYRR